MSIDVDERTEREEPAALESELPDPAPSGLDQLREVRKEIAADDHHDLNVPGYRGLLVARYHRIDWEEIAKIRRKAARAAAKNPAVEPDVRATSDLLALACAGLHKRVDGELVALQDLDPSLGSEPVTYDDRGARALGVAASSAREAIAQIFVHDSAIVLHGQELMLWLGQANEELGEDFD
jgi:hypothetical protein